MNNKFKLFNVDETILSQDSNWRGSVKLKFTIGIITIMICSLFFLTRIFQEKGQVTTISQGYIWNNETLVADFSFPILRDGKEYQDDVRKARENALEVYQLNNEVNGSTLISNFLTGLELGNMDPDQASTFKRDLKDRLEKFAKNVYSSGFIDREISEIKNDKIIIRSKDNLQEIKLLNSIYDFSKLNDLFTRNLSNIYSEDISSDIRSKFISKLESNLIFDQKATEKNKEIASENIPKTNGLVRREEIIIRQGDKITKNHILKLQSYNSAQYQLEGDSKDILPILGSLGHVLIILSFIMLYIFRPTNEMFRDNFNMILICSFLIFIVVLSWLSINLSYDLPIHFLILLPAISMLATVIYDAKTSFYLTVTLAFLVAGIRTNDYSTGLTMLFAGLMAIYSVRDIQNRTQVYQSIFYILIGLSIPILVFGFERSESWLEIFQKIGFAGINSALSPIATFGLLFLIERTTTISTDLRIQEFDNLNHPLLIKMNEVAPGTYQHSLGVSALSERCAIEIGANSLFCRVAPYFHDIGKIEKPEYFAENQINMDNKHDLISPVKSAQIIKNHVVNGAKMAQNAGLPEKIIDVIYMHHGTSLIKHFYAKAVEQDGKENVDIDDFRYPGPKPNSKETAIIMICDAAEAISRLGNKTKEELDTMIKDIINNFIAQGQFDQCEITAKEFATIRKTISKNIQGMIHKRVDYKKIDEEENVK